MTAKMCPGFLHELQDEITGERRLFTVANNGETWWVIARIDQEGRTCFEHDRRQAELADKEHALIASTDCMIEFLRSWSDLSMPQSQWIQRVVRQPGLNNRGRDHFLSAVQELRKAERLGAFRQDQVVARA